MLLLNSQRSAVASCLHIVSLDVSKEWPLSRKSRSIAACLHCVGASALYYVENSRETQVNFNKPFAGGQSGSGEYLACNVRKKQFLFYAK
ncbi:MAG TPA: hypothetical protein QF353_02335 [Gammaproteobacteria bacterium]|nr:hypothetical protein [Gammaproteobacteria bacterium]